MTHHAKTRLFLAMLTY